MYGSAGSASLSEKTVAGAVDVVAETSGCGDGVKAGFCNNTAALSAPEKIIDRRADAVVSASDCAGGVKIGFLSNLSALSAPEKIIDCSVDAVIRASGCGGGAVNSAGLCFLNASGVLRAACKGAPHRVQNLWDRVPRSAPHEVQYITCFAEF
jgi:hypothetical protein